MEPLIQRMMRVLTTDDVVVTHCLWADGVLCETEHEMQRGPLRDADLDRRFEGGERRGRAGLIYSGVL